MTKDQLQAIRVLKTKIAEMYVRHSIELNALHFEINKLTLNCDHTLTIISAVHNGRCEVCGKEL